MKKPPSEQGWPPDPQLQQVLKILSDRKPHKAGEIAFTLGLHSRTIRRVLHRLRDELGYDIDASRMGFTLRD